MKKILITLLGALVLLCGQRVNAQISDIDGTWSFGGGFTGMSVTGSDAAASGSKVKKWLSANGRKVFQVRPR